MTLMQVSSKQTIRELLPIIFIFVVFVDFQLSPGNGCSGFLYFPFTMNHIRSDGRDLLLWLCTTAEPLLRQTDLLLHAIYLIYFVYRQADLYSPEMNLQLIITRNVDGPCHY